MKQLACLVAFFSLCVVSYAQGLNCKKVTTGTFKSVIDAGEEKIVTMIYREKEKQVEECVQAGLKMEFNIKWTSACTYELSNPRILKGSLPGTSASHILYVKITEVYDGGYKAEVSSNFSDVKEVMDFSTMK